MTEQSTDYRIGLKTQGRKRYSVMIQHHVYQQLKIITIQTEQPIYELVNKALTHYLANPPAIDNYSFESICLNKRIAIHDNVYRLLQQESRNTGQTIQRIATDAFIQYLNRL